MSLVCRMRKTRDTPVHSAPLLYSLLPGQAFTVNTSFRRTCLSSSIHTTSTLYEQNRNVPSRCRPIPRGPKTSTWKSLNLGRTTGGVYAWKLRPDRKPQSLWPPRLNPLKIGEPVELERVDIQPPVSQSDHLCTPQLVSRCLLTAGLLLDPVIQTCAISAT